MDAVSWGCERLDAFAIGDDIQIYHKYWNGPDEDNAWKSLGGGSLSPPAAVSSKRGHLDVFHRSVDKGVYVKHLADSTWSSWVNLGGKTEGNLATVSWGPDRVDIYALGGAEGQTPYRKTKDGETWSSTWEDLDGRFKSELAAVSWSPGRIDVVGIGLNDAMFIKSYSGGRWLAGWNSLGGSFNSPPTIVSRGSGLLDVFAVDKSGVPQWKSFNGAWSEWQTLGGVLYSAMTVKVTSFFGTKRIDIFALGGADRVYQKTYNGVTNKWEGWTSHGTAFDTEPVLASWGSDRLDILCIGKSSDMWHQSWNGTSWEPSLGTWASDAGVFKKFP